jgi:hypothetical protein
MPRSYGRCAALHKIGSLRQVHYGGFAGLHRSRSRCCSAGSLAGRVPVPVCPCRRWLLIRPLPPHRATSQVLWREFRDDAPAVAPGSEKSSYVLAASSYSVGHSF